MITKNLIKITLIFLSLLILLSSCGSVDKLKSIRKPVDLRTSPLDPDERAKRNIKEGRGISLGNLGKSGSTTYEFSTSNPMWRASLETLDFLPLSTVDYSGGIIITDWYSDESSGGESIKISLRFLGNDIRSESLKIIVHKKTCTPSSNCKVVLLSNTKITEEVHSEILRKASLLEQEAKNKKPK
jgi:hypothetical protein